MAPAARLVLDWDGTCTQVDGLHMILERFGDRAVFERMEGVLGESLTLHEVIGAEFATVSAPLDEVVAWAVANVRLRPGFHELAAERSPLILSSGFHELIDPILAREGVELEVLANRLDPDPEGWRTLWRDEARCAACGEACKRNAVAGAPYVYAGDGYSDRCVARAATQLFARDGLATWCEAEEIAYTRFDDLRDILAALEGDES